MNVRKVTVAITAVAVLGTGLVACGSSDDDYDPCAVGAFTPIVLARGGGSSAGGKSGGSSSGGRVAAPAPPPAPRPAPVAPVRPAAPPVKPVPVAPKVAPPPGYPPAPAGKHYKKNSDGTFVLVPIIEFEGGGC